MSQAYSDPKRPELIDWAERFPKESARDIAVRQSTVCPCGKPKEIGQPTCGHADAQEGGQS